MGAREFPHPLLPWYAPTLDRLNSRHIARVVLTEYDLPAGRIPTARYGAPRTPPQATFRNF